jgi:hypothetical protein
VRAGFLQSYIALSTAQQVRPSGAGNMVLMLRSHDCGRANCRF